MQYKTLGNTGVKVSELCFGTMSFGGDADKESSKAMFKRCREEGINFFDCANVYNSGRSEELLGEFIKDDKCRDQVIITSKVYGRIGEGVNERGLSRYHIRKAVEDSLRRLQTDRIDLYFVHNFDETIPVEESLRVFDDLVREGKILYPAVSNWAAWQIEKALGISAREGLARFECVQPMYNLVKRQVEVEILPMAEEENLAIVPYSPLGAGLLTGKYDTENRPEKGRLVDNEMYNQRYGLDSYFQIAEKFVKYADEREINPVTLAVAWVKSHPAVTAPIIGARNVNQLEDSLAAVDINLTEEWREEISDISITPPPATDRLEETFDMQII